MEPDRAAAAAVARTALSTPAAAAGFAAGGTARRRLRAAVAIFATAAAALLSGPAQAADPPAIDGNALFAEHCAVCHHPGRLGGVGPALLPENLGRLRPKAAASVIATGRPATQMEGFKDKLTPAQIDALVKFIYTPLPAVPDWTLADMAESHVVHTPLADLPAAPVHTADPLNLFTVVETGDHHVTILNGDRLEPIWRFPSRFALHGGAKYSPDGRFVYLGSRDGWVSKYDLWSLKPVAEIRAGINTRNIAVSSDGKWVAVGNFLPHTIVILDAAELTPHKIIPVSDGKGRSSRVSAVYNAPPRKSFIAALKDFKEVWELSYDPDAQPVYPGFVHNYREGQVEGIAPEPQPFARRRIKLADYMDDFFFDPDYIDIIGASRDGHGGAVYNLDARRKVADLALDGMPHLGSGIVFQYGGHPVMATPHLREGAVSVIDMVTWKTVKTIKTLGPGFFMRSHDASPYAWVDVFFGKDRDALHVIDKTTLEIVRTVRPQPGTTAAHVEFDRYGKFALVSVWDDRGALVVYDARTLKEVKRIPMRKPVGKYNVWNKITYEAGTSH
ncbi:MAG: c-type cytochrome [Hyphomicrobiales bacterium]|nr:c-type cytochrome [Hyphomicrobiales bacterium]MCP5373288.1 c-type cytochrome [Hyphomicrobiales bacterium]